MTLTTSEAATLACLMEKASFPLPREVFFAWNKAFYANAMEQAIVRKNLSSGRWEVLMALRPTDDPHYGGMWHMPGSIQLPGKTMRETVSNCLKRELGNDVHNAIADRIPDTFIKCWDNTDEVRGHTNQFLWLIDIGDTGIRTDAAQFFPLDGLPTPLVKSHVRMTTWLREHLA